MNEILELNDIKWEIFIEKIGFNFPVMFDWIDAKKSMNMHDFINTKIEAREADIIRDFENRPTLFNLVIRTENIESLKVGAEEKDFLQSFNIITVTAKGQIQWHDRIVEQAFEKLRKKQER